MIFFDPRRYISAKEPCISAKEPHLSAKEGETCMTGPVTGK